MVGAPVQFDGEAGLSGDGGDDAAGFTGFFQHASLFDMDFDIAPALALGVADDGGSFVPAVVLDGGGDGDTIGVASGEGGGIERACDGAAAEIGGLETGAFFVGKGEEMDREGELDLFLLEIFQSGEDCDDSQRAVVFPGIDDGVEMGS